MANILLLFSTTDGHTIKICNRLKQVIERHAHRATVSAIDACDGLDLHAFDKIVIGASIRYGRHSQRVVDFIANHLPLLESKANAFFSVNIVARKPEKNRSDTNPYMRRFLKRCRWHPQQLAVFAGKLDYPKYGFFDRLMIRFIMLLTKGPTDPNLTIEFTDWKEVEDFGRQLSEM